MLDKLRKETKKLSSEKRASSMQKYFKTEEGEYGFGDIFIGLTVPQCRELAIKYKEMNFDELYKLLRSEIHEERLIALLILVYNFQKEELLQRRIYEFYLKNIKFVNNWDLVDLSADKIMGGYLIDKPKDILYKMAKSNRLWEKRIAIISTFHFIKKDKFEDALSIAEILLPDENELIQKAVGWMLREVGKRDKKLETQFLDKHYKNMGRVSLRYSIEKFSQKSRQAYMLGTV